MIKSGVIVSGLILLPNILYFLKRRGKSDDRASHVSVSTSVEISENIGRLGILVIPIFYSLNLNHRFSLYFMILCLLFLSLYYIAWLRYFIGGSHHIDLRRRLFVPLPLAVYPSLFLICSSYLLSSILMLMFSLVFAIAHIWVSKIES